MESPINNEIRDLLSGFLSHEITGAEKKRLEELILSPANEKSIRENLFLLLNEFNDHNFNEVQTDFERTYENILFEIKNRDLIEREMISGERKRRFKKVIVQGLSIAALITVVFFIGSLYPSVRKSDSAGSSSAITYTEIKAPFGSKSEILLPDGTEVMLNAGSSIKYGSDFSLDNRDIALAGEAYFKVARNIDLPLIVNAGNINIKAVGTEFNIKAYEDDGIIETTLLEGKVEITQSGEQKDDIRFIDLNPNQKAIYIKESGSFTLSEVNSIAPPAVAPVKSIYENILISPKADVDQVVAWTKGKLIIRGENLENMSVELQRKYDVTFNFLDEDIKKFRFTGVLLDETLEQVLNVIKLTAPIDYYVEGKTVFMKSDKEHMNHFSKHLK